MKLSDAKTNKKGEAWCVDCAMWVVPETGEDNRGNGTIAFCPNCDLAFGFVMRERTKRKVGVKDLDDATIERMVEIASELFTGFGKEDVGDWPGLVAEVKEAWLAG